LFVQRDLDRISLGTKKWPVFTLRYTMGVKGILGSDFNYHKLSFGIGHVMRLGILGKLEYDFNAGKIFSKIPYPLLEVHMGNQSPYYTARAFSLMNYFEFISDSYISLRLIHHFEGLFFNRIPLIKKLKWRFLVTGSGVFGGVSPSNLSLIPNRESFNGPKHKTFYTLEQMPYLEAGYGIDNIFKILRIDFFHRLTYRDHPGVSKFGVKFSIQFTL
jgi:hypothetical protein